MTKRNFLAAIAAIALAPIVSRLSEPLRLAAQPCYPHVVYERFEGNIMTSDERFEIRVNHGPRTWHAAACATWTEGGFLNLEGIAEAKKRAWRA